MNRSDPAIVKPPDGQAIWRALKDELLDNLYALPFSTLPPTVFHVYLHPDDFETIERIVPRIVGELATALTTDVERFNNAATRRASVLDSWLRPATTAPPIEVPAGGWEIHIEPDHDRELARGAFGVVSQLSLPARPEYGGTPTVRTIRTVFTDGRRTSSSASETTAAVAPAAPTDGASANDGARSATTRPAGHRATLRYRDDGGEHVFLMKKDLIKIGRGGSDAWVDVQVITAPKVSREHCWIRADATGRFFIRDVSNWGTLLNGQNIPTPVRSADGAVVEPGAEQEVPADARIDLADALTIQFHAESRA